MDSSSLSTPPAAVTVRASQAITWTGDEAKRSARHERHVQHVEVESDADLFSETSDRGDMNSQSTSPGLSPPK